MGCNLLICAVDSAQMLAGSLVCYWIAWCTQGSGVCFFLLCCYPQGLLLDVAWLSSSYLWNNFLPFLLHHHKTLHFLSLLPLVFFQLSLFTRVRQLTGQKLGSKWELT